MPLHDGYQILTPDFDEIGGGEGLAFRIHQINYETHVTIEPVCFEKSDCQIRPQHWRPNRVTLSWGEIITLLEELEPLLRDFHPCARCDHQAAPGHQLCPACELEEARYREFEEQPCPVTY